jgi:predicted nucleic acid-binding protein
VSQTRPRGPIVIDTDVFSADLVPGAPLAERYAPIIAGRPALISFHTAAQLRYGALRRGWGQARMLRLEAKIQRAEIVHTGPELVLVYAHLALIATHAAARSRNAHTPPTAGSPATAIRLGVPLVSNDKIFRDVPNLALESLAS